MQIHCESIYCMQLLTNLVLNDTNAGKIVNYS